MKARTSGLREMARRERAPHTPVMPARNRAHYRGTYGRRAREVRRRANADPSTRCWRCGRTLDQHEPHHDGRPPHWQAGHLIDADPSSPLAPEASTCNTSAGATAGNTGRRRRGNPHSRRW